MCCINIRDFVDQFYQFTDGVAQQHLDIDEVLRKVSLVYRVMPLADQLSPLTAF